MKNIVVIGGGTGLSSMLMGMKQLEDVNLTAIVTVADSGGSTGRIRDMYHVPAIGDIRHVLCAMAQDEDETLFADLLSYRFQGSQDIGGHNLGNLMFLALMDMTGSFMGAIEAISRVLKIQGTILPSTLDIVDLYAVMDDGTLVRGEDSIPKARNSIDHVFYQKKVKPHYLAIEAIEQADLIIYGIGSLYTSIMPNLIIPEISKAIQNNPNPKIYFCNAMSQQGETDGYSVEDHIRAIEKHSFPNAVDLVVVNQSYIPQTILENYAKEGSVPLKLKENTHPYGIMQRLLVQFDALGRIRHNPDAVKQAVYEIIKKIDQKEDLRV
ncbi:MAG: YvcK family protein, partial [Erysipelotrichaceae bacterium]|nr:YvcK family protein [Erysipelotrichaceae bacterium]